MRPPASLSPTPGPQVSFLLAVEAERKRALSLLELGLASKSRLMPGNYMVPFRRVSRKRGSSPLDLHFLQVCMEVVTLMRFRTRGTPAGPRLCQSSSCSQSPLLVVKLFVRAVTTGLNRGTSNLIITMIVMAVTQKEKFRSHKIK